MKFLFVTYILSDGGAERVISVLANKLADKGHEVNILLYRRTDNEYHINDNVKIYSLKKNEKLYERVIKKILKPIIIRNIIKKTDSDVIIPFVGGVVIDSFIASIGLKVPIIATVRVRPKKHFIKDFVFEHCAAVFMQTNSQKKYFSKKIVDKSFVIPNPVNQLIIDSGEHKVYSNTIKNIITCGRLSSQKNHTMLIEAMIIVHEKYPDVNLKIFGQGEEYENLKNIIESKNLSSFISLEGRCDEIENELLKADLFALSSDFEGMPNALMEAMACGLPCVSTNCPTGPYELLGKSERGLLVPVNNAEKFAAALKFMIRNPEKAVKFGKSAQEYAIKHFTPEVVADSLICESLKVIEKGKKTNE